MSDEDDKKADLVTKPFLRKIDALIGEFEKKAKAEGYNAIEAYQLMGEYMGYITGGLGALQLQKEAVKEGLASLSADEVLDSLNLVTKMAGQRARIGFLNLLAGKFKMDLDTLYEIEQERKELDHALSKIKPPKDPKEFN